MSHSPTIESLDDIVSDGSGDSCLTVADAACRLGISRSTLYRAIKRGKLKAITRGNGVRGIEVSELQRAYSKGTGTKATTIGKLSSEAERSRLAQLEAELLLSSAHVKMLETQLRASKEKEAAQEQEIDGLRAQQTSHLPGIDAGLRKTPDATYYSRKRRSKVKKLIRRTRMLIGVVSLIIAATGTVIGIVYVIDQSGWTQSSGY